MALISLRQLLDHAAEQGYGVPAFNINNMEQGLAIMKAAAKLDAPVILQASRGARTYAGDPMLRAMVTALVEIVITRQAMPPRCLHVDLHLSFHEVANQPRCRDTMLQLKLATR